jgi:hypothetical protein
MQLDHAEYQLRLAGEWVQLEGDPGQLCLRCDQPRMALQVSVFPQDRPRGSLSAHLEEILAIDRSVSSAMQGWQAAPVERRRELAWERSISRSWNPSSGARLRLVFIVTTRKTVKARLELYDHDEAAAEAMLAQVLEGLVVRTP